MVTEIVYSVIRDTSNRRVTVTSEEDVKAAAKKGSAGKDTAAKPAAAKTPRKKAAPKVEKKAVEPEIVGDDIVGKVCPLCGKGTIIKGKTAYGCSEWKNGCGFRKPF